jgi:malonyl-CoA O-methyltransferase
MHDIGDALVRSGLAEPVLDVDRLSITYDNTGALTKDLAMSGSGNCLAGRRNTLTGGRRFETMLGRLGDGRITIDLELVFGHAWGRGARPRAGEVRIEPGAIGRFERP